MTAEAEGRPCQAKLLTSSDPDRQRWFCPQCGPNINGPCEGPERVVHCWEDGPLTEDGCSTTCMLPDKHKGPHQWARDDEIIVRFK